MPGRGEGTDPLRDLRARRPVPLDPFGVLEGPDPGSGYLFLLVRKFLHLLPECRRVTLPRTGVREQLLEIADGNLRMLERFAAAVTCIPSRAPVAPGQEYRPLAQGESRSAGLQNDQSSLHR